MLPIQKAIDMERWKDIPGYEGLYQASDTGHIRTVEGKVTHSVRHGIRHWKSRVLKEKWEKRVRCKSGHRDARVQLYKDKHSKTHLVARLVAMTWVKGFEEGLTVNHIDGDPSNNNISNLEWVSRKDNIRKGFETGCYKLSANSVCLIAPTGESYDFSSLSEASRFLGRDNGYVSLCKKKMRKPKDRNGVPYEVIT